MLPEVQMAKRVKYLIGEKTAIGDVTEECNMMVEGGVGINNDIVDEEEDAEDDVEESVVIA